MLSALVLASCTTINMNPATDASEGDADEASAQQAAAKKAASSDKDSPFKPWDKALEDTRKIDGFLPMHLKADDRTVYAEVSPDLLDTDFGLVMHISKGTGVFNLHDGLRLSSTRLMRFTRVGDKLHLVHRNTRFTADEGSAMKTSLDDNTGHSILEALKIESQHDSTKALLVDVTGFFVSDYANIGEGLRFYFDRKPARFDKGKSYVDRVRGFPENMEIDAALTYQGAEYPSTGGEAIPDYRAIPVGVRYSLFQLPEDPMTPRFADDRVGHFTDAIKDFSADQEMDPYRVFVNRWRLEPSDPDAFARGELVEPVEPIVYYVDHSVPERYRPYVKEGIEGWNKAFERAGFKNAIVAKDAPDDSTWSAEDIRFSTVRWTAAHQMGYAIGPSQSDPRTGELLNADVLISSTFVRGWRRDYEELTPEAMTKALQPEQTMAAKNPAIHPEWLCVAEHGKAHQLGLQHALLVGRGLISANEPMPEEYLADAVRDLILHEVGHTLGLRHNFKASSAIPYDRLHDEDYTRENGVSLSVMDYAPVNVALDADAQGHYWNKEPGAYDGWAIEYAYRPVMNDGAMVTDPAAETDALDAIAREADDPEHTYGTDGDRGYGLDPLANAWELGSDPLRFATDRTELVRTVEPMLEERLVQEGDAYARLRSATTTLIFARYRSLMPAAKMIGGLYVARDHKGDPQGRMPFTPVEAERQRDAVQLLVDEAFAADAFQFDPERLNKLMPDRMSHWGNGFGTLDFSVHDYVASIQGGLMNAVLNPTRLGRMIDNAARVADGAEAYRPSELLATMTDAVWSELESGAEINTFRINLQRAYTDQLIRLMLETPPFRAFSGGGIQEVPVPEHVRSLARLELTELSDQIGQAMNGALDRDLQAHLTETQVRIDRALNASMTKTFE